MTDIKLVATDIDGTIMNFDFTISDEVKNCISNLAKMGIKVILVTGRMHAATTYVAEELGLETPIVSYQGGLIRLGGEILYERNLDVDIAKDIIKWAKANDVHLNLYMNDELYVEKDDAVVRRYTGERATGFIVKSFEDVELHRINKMLAIDFADENRVTSWHDYLKEKYPNITIVKSTPYFCEICHNEAKKSSAVNFLKDYYGLNRKEILTIGDQNNDIELLRAGGTKIAMGNATDELKAVSDYVTDSVSQNGFVSAIEKFVLINGGCDEVRL